MRPAARRTRRASISSSDGTCTCTPSRKITRRQCRWCGLKPSCSLRATCPCRAAHPRVATGVRADGRAPLALQADTRARCDDTCHHSKKEASPPQAHRPGPAGWSANNLSPKQHRQITLGALVLGTVRPDPVLTAAELPNALGEESVRSPASATIHGSGTSVRARSGFQPDLGS